MSNKTIERIVQLSYYFLIIELLIAVFSYNDGKLVAGNIIYPVIGITVILMIVLLCYYYLRKGK